MTFDQFKEHLQREIRLWEREQVKDPTAAYYAYYLPATPTRESGVRISTYRPDLNWKLMHTKRVNGFRTAEENYNILVGVAQSLPILGGRADTTSNMLEQTNSQPAHEGT